MCTGDVAPILFYDDPSQELPLPDFSTMHQCRNFEDLLKWSHTNDRALEWDKIDLLDAATLHTRRRG
jgi:hypothetical protein